MLKPHRTHEDNKVSAFSEFQKLKFMRHPNVTYVYDVFEYRDACYIITERCLSLPETTSDSIGGAGHRGRALT